MTIQINTDKTLDGDKKHQEFFTSQIKEELKRFDSHITRIEVHLKDENGKKEGFNDISCLLEARLEGRKPIAVKTKAGTSHQAISGAIDKMKSSLESIIGKLQEH